MLPQLCSIRFTVATLASAEANARFVFLARDDATLLATDVDHDDAADRRDDDERGREHGARAHAAKGRPLHGVATSMCSTNDNHALLPRASRQTGFDVEEEGRHDASRSARDPRRNDGRGRGHSARSRTLEARDDDAPRPVADPLPKMRIFGRLAHAGRARDPWRRTPQSVCEVASHPVRWDTGPLIEISGSLSSAALVEDVRADAEVSGSSPTIRCVT